MKKFNELQEKISKIIENEEEKANNQIAEDPKDIKKELLEIIAEMKEIKFNDTDLKTGHLEFVMELVKFQEFDLDEFYDAALELDGHQYRGSSDEELEEEAVSRDNLANVTFDYKNTLSSLKSSIKYMNNELNKKAKIDKPKKLKR